MPDLAVGALMEMGLGTLVQHYSVFGWVAGQPEDAKAILPERFRGMDSEKVVRTLKLASSNLLVVDTAGNARSRSNSWQPEQAQARREAVCRKCPLPLQQPAA